MAFILLSGTQPSFTTSLVMYNSQVSLQPHSLMHPIPPKASLFWIHSLKATIQKGIIMKRHQTRKVWFGAQRFIGFYCINS